MEHRVIACHMGCPTYHVEAGMDQKKHHCHLLDTNMAERYSSVQIEILETKSPTRPHEAHPARLLRTLAYPVYPRRRTTDDNSILASFSLTVSYEMLH